MKYIFQIPALLLLGVCMVGCSFSHTSLESAIQSQWNSTEIQIINVDERNEAVIFTDKDAGNTLYVFGLYNKDRDKYTYDPKFEDGWTVAFSNSNGSILVNTIDRDRIGNVIWGVVNTGQEAEVVKLNFTYKNDPNTNMELEIPVINNTFIGYPPYQFFDSTTPVTNDWEIKVKSYDKNQQVVAETEI